jgi:hypothetical protein
LYETYLYEEFLINALAGRALNCNRVDDSSIYYVKSEQFIENRLGHSLRKVDAEQLAQASIIAYKMPDVVPFLSKLKAYYPGTSVIIILRKALDVFNSLLEKEWFNDRVLLQQNVVWPNRFLHGFSIPFWVDPKDDEVWCEMDELHRIAYYYIKMNQNVNDITDCYTIRYDDLVENPRETSFKLAERLNLSFGDKTEKIITTIKCAQKSRDLTLLKKLKPDIREQVEYLSKMS